jgi:hypothetical protein
MRRRQRIQNDLSALRGLAASRSNFSWWWRGQDIVLAFAETPGLVRTERGVETCDSWEATLTFPPFYPIDEPIVTLSPAGREGAPYHPNVLPVWPFLLCYGRHLPDLLLDELARRIERMIVLMPGSVTTDETDSLNHDACKLVRRLIREGVAPLTLGEQGRQRLPGGAARGGAS